jgi:hypothetical protein
MTDAMTTPASDMTTGELLAADAKIDNYLSKATTLDGHTGKPAIRSRRDEIRDELERRGVDLPPVSPPVFPYGKIRD